MLIYEQGNDEELNNINIDRNENIIEDVNNVSRVHNLDNKENTNNINLSVEDVNDVNKVHNLNNNESTHSDLLVEDYENVDTIIYITS